MNSDISDILVYVLTVLGMVGLVFALFLLWLGFTNVLFGIMDYFDFTYDRFFVGSVSVGVFLLGMTIGGLKVHVGGD